MGQFTTVLRNHEKLTKRRIYSERLLVKLKDELAKRPACNRAELCVYTAGSLARCETGQASDLDLFFIGHNPRRDDRKRSVSRLEELCAFAEFVQVNSTLGLQPFSGDGLYLKVHELDDLIKGTGSSEDDSENLFTTRLLLLLESKPLIGDSLYEESVSEVLRMYFRDGRGHKDFRPLFVLNDILRYWRTLCLNYERDRTAPGKPWWKRNLNLKFPRKLTVYSTVLCIIATKMTREEDFKKITHMTPMQRLAFALDHMDDIVLLKDFPKILDDYEDFLAAKSHSELEAEDAHLMAVFSEKAQRFDDFLHQAFSSPKLEPRLVRYLLI